MDLPEEIDQIGIHLGGFVFAPIAQDPVDLLHGVGKTLATLHVLDGQRFLAMDVVERKRAVARGVRRRRQRARGQREPDDETGQDPQRRLSNRLSPSQPGSASAAPRLPQPPGSLYERIDARACALATSLEPLEDPVICIERGHCGKIGAKRTVDDPAALSVQFARSSRPNSRILR